MVYGTYNHNWGASHCTSGISRSFSNSALAAKCSASIFRRPRPVADTAPPAVLDAAVPLAETCGLCSDGLSYAQRIHGAGRFTY